MLGNVEFPPRVPEVLPRKIASRRSLAETSGSEPAEWNIVPLECPAGAEINEMPDEEDCTIFEGRIAQGYNSNDKPWQNGPNLIQALKDRQVAENVKVQKTIDICV